MQDARGARIYTRGSTDASDLDVERLKKDFSDVVKEMDKEQDAPEPDKSPVMGV